ncbi:tRNA guanosine-2'-O-methyltransferase [Hymenopellis radicata]|nr:tRNA guanosine-2'-O-methyltransferase [Hymenopellis radicata]
MATQYLIFFAQTHHDFRIPELQSLSELYSLKIDFLEENPDPTRPFMIVNLESEEHAYLLASRSILIKAVYEYYGHAATYEQVHAINLENRSKWEKYIPDTSFKFIITGFNHTIPQRRQREVVETFSYMGFLGKIDMKNPEITLACYEEYDAKHGTTRAKHEGDGEFKQVYFGRLVATGSARALIAMFDVKKRSYYGNTSMEAEISLLMANQTLASPGKLMYDPFMGTGSMAYPIAHFGAQMIGSDIDGRQMRGKEKTPGVLRAASQYGVEARVIDLCTFDITNHPWRCGEFFDAIITDPPYGVRAGAKRLGRKQELPPTNWQPILNTVLPHDHDQPYIPPTKPYELSKLAVDLVLMARYLLRHNGRLVFFLPTVNEEYEEVDIHTMLCSGMEVVANSLQDFGSWGRRLVTIRKTTKDAYPPPSFSRDYTPAHKDFREKYFRGFKPEISGS